MVATRSNSRNVPIKRAAEKGMRPKRSPRAAKAKSKGGTMGKSSASVSRSKPGKVLQKSVASARMKTTLKKFENAENVSRRGQKILLDKSSDSAYESEVIKEPHSSPVIPQKGKGGNKWEDVGNITTSEEVFHRQEDFENTGEEENSTTAFSRLRRSKRSAGKEASHKREDFESAGENDDPCSVISTPKTSKRRGSKEAMVSLEQKDFRNTSEEDNKNAVISRPMKSRKRASNKALRECEDVYNSLGEDNSTAVISLPRKSKRPANKETFQKWEVSGNSSDEDNTSTVITPAKKLKTLVGNESFQDSGVRRSGRSVKQKNNQKENKVALYSTSSSSSASGDSEDEYIGATEEDSEEESEEESVQSDVESLSSDTKISETSAKKRKISSSRKSSGRKQVSRSKTREKSKPAGLAKSKTGKGSASKTSITSLGTRARVAKPLKPWQKTDDAPPRELGKIERKMMKFCIMAANLAQGRVHEMTEHEGNEIVQQLRAASETKQTSPLLSSVTHESNEVEEGESSEDEWEEMELADIGDYDTAKNVQVMLEKSDKKDWWALYLRQEVNKRVRYNWDNSHKVNILCYIGHLQFLKKVIVEENLIPSLILTSMPSSYQKMAREPMTVENARRINRWYYITFKASEAPVKYKRSLCRSDATERYSDMIAEGVYENDADRAALLFAIFVSMGCTARICVNTLPIPRKWDESITSKIAKMKKSSTSTLTPKKMKKGGRRKTVSKNKGTTVNEYHGAVRNYWVEYWDTKERRWICVDPLSVTVGDPTLIEENITKPVLYILAIDNEGGVREVTARYVSDFWRADFRRRRTDPKWLTSTLRKNYIRADRYRSEQENLEFRQELVKKSLPATVAEYKNHPLYVLEKDLLKFEGIYPRPEDQKPLGEICGHKVYPRSTVYTLLSASNWIKLARSIKEGENAYKVVKARPDFRVPAEERVQRYLDVFGFWQTEPYRPPKVVNGRIPRNEYGNVYMYQPSMCPIGAVHLRLPGLPSIARRLGGLECVPVVVGWDYNSCSNFPIIEGACVLEEDAEKFISEWKRLEESRKEREDKKREERVLGNWRKLIRGILRHQYLKSKFRAAKVKRKVKKEKNEVKEESEQDSYIIDNTAMVSHQVFTHDDLMKL
ncbi:hypothetical protein KIN20_007288 [Parelaphostrongylus tenuis]|uniref:Uncharacterized protein n=1 Tax=Parelaphostrongylus tenuis TaxID=148309 RepID=A0AAD5M353_PARTN|nr:hypothetical protein KIN20_007288 [Parelaphostrongylus tenuis]